MASMPVLVIGLDAAWRSRMQRLLAMRGEFDWLGAFAPGQPRESPNGQPALLLLDGDDPEVDRARRKPQLPAPRRLYFYRTPNVEALQHCIDAQGHACLDKHDSPDTVMRAIRAAESGLFVVAPETPGRGPARGHRRPCAGAGRRNAAARRTRPRGRLVVAHRAPARDRPLGPRRGMSNKQIARQLGISPETVKTHLHHVFEREGVHGRMALLAAHVGERATPAPG